MRSGPRFLWLGVAWMINDCVASIRAMPATELERGSSNSGGDGGSGSGSGSGLLAVLVDKFSVRFFRFQRGELVVLRSPEEPDRRLVRRLVAVQEDHVAVAGPTPGSKAQVERIPKGHCWCEADAGARAVGGDSRLAWGPVPLALIEGRVTRVLWPPSRWGTLPPQPSLTRVVGKGGTLEFLQPPSREQDWWS
ncbi:Mitochondrial inner membrane protease subunit 2 [Chlorella sorokiniana]|uniref:Mitochondrial inner membrane protease subunit 2 n=1 Tax=Chlorella sorokiniana TaxID=3076 RepID=A0A2P6TS20_CHLSO|nr:Mitochondrial inner membrane protease subunit 2 [Chlorella sorokiniana]|eukprot:PRW56852.1 Mitochondrial inner membrane protease subunit 2 [Chlorella sorokiniana]